jgi:hypothetical protein
MDENRRVFTAFIEIQPLDGCEIDPLDVAGAFVRCHVRAANEIAAMETVKDDLNVRRMKLVDTEWCLDHDATNWEKNDPHEQALVEEARSGGYVTYGAFDEWGHDAPDAT